MITIKGTEHKQSSTDNVQRCKKCGRIFYFPHHTNGVWVICPHCKTKH